MNRIEFNGPMERLTKTYGDRNYPEERIAGIFRAVQRLPQWAWADVVEGLICERLTAPLRNQVLEAARPFLEEAMKAELANLLHELEQYDPCKWCKYTGLITARFYDYSIDRHCIVVFRCSYCRAADVRRLSRGIVLWKRQEGYTPLYAEGGEPDPWDIPEPHSSHELPKARDQLDHDPQSQPGKVQAIVDQALVGKRMLPPPADFEQIDFEIDL